MSEEDIKAENKHYKDQFMRDMQELCTCGHNRLVHGGVASHGACARKCDCVKFTWDGDSNGE